MRFLPRSYVEAFVDPDAKVDGDPAVWVHRAAFGVFKAVPVEPRGGERHFNVPDSGTLRHNVELERRLAMLEEIAARLIRERLAERGPLAPDERDVLATYFAILGIRLSSRFGDLDDSEAVRGFEELRGALREMGWVLWEAEPPFYFVSSSAPFHAAFPKDDGLVQGQELHAPGVELTLPLMPRLALHATWKRRGELWRHAGEAVLLELNARTKSIELLEKLGIVQETTGRKRDRGYQYAGYLERLRAGTELIAVGGRTATRSVEPRTPKPTR